MEKALLAFGFDELKLHRILVHCDAENTGYYQVMDKIGYNVDKKHHGNGYAARACRLVAPVAKAHHITKLLITNNVNNTASTAGM